MKGGIATRLAILSSLVALVATATVGFMVYRGARDSLIQSASDRLAHTAETISVRTWATLDAMGGDVRFLAKTPPVQGIVRARTRYGLDPMWSIRDDEWGEQLADIFRAFLESRSSYLQARFIGMAQDGRELVRVERRGGQATFADPGDLRSQGDKPYVRDGAKLAPGQLYLSEVVYSDGSEGIPPETPILYIGTPVFSADGQIFGVVVVTVDFADFLATVISQVDPTQTLYVANGRGELIHSSGRAPAKVRAGVRLQDLFPVAQELIAGEPQEVQMLDTPLGGESRGIAYFEEITLDGDQTSPSLLFGVSEPHETILAGVRKIRNESAMITLLLCVAAIVLALTTSRYLTIPIRQISRAVTAFGGNGDRGTLPVDRRDEIGLLARSYQGMERQIQEQMRVLEDEERRQRTILETSAEGIIVADAGWRIEGFNRAAEVIFGCSSSDVVGEHVSRLIPRLKMESESEEGLPGRGPGIEVAGKRVDGAEVPVSVLWSTFEWGGEEKYTIFVQDISERKESEEAREHLLRELEAERKRLRELSATLEARVRERTAELERANMDLEVSNRELREIANVASHDLQEPLRKLRSFADLLESEYGDVLDEAGKFYSQRIFGLAERMSRLIGDLLAFSRVTASPKPFKKVDLCQVVEDVVTEHTAEIDELGGAVHVGGLPKIEADPLQIRELFDNLVDNALKHRRPDEPPVVHIRGGVEEDAEGALTCRIEVQDNGVGFEQKYVDRIFTPFERLQGKRTIEGTGMGLTICRRIAENHRGTITAQSEPGKGTTFVVTLPQRALLDATVPDAAV